MPTMRAANGARDALRLPAGADGKDSPPLDATPSAEHQT